MKTLTVDAHKRIRIPDAQPHSVFAYENHGDGTITLVKIDDVRKPRFPRGSLLKFLNSGRDHDQIAIIKSCAQGPQ